MYANQQELQYVELTKISRIFLFSADIELAKKKHLQPDDFNEVPSHLRCIPVPDTQSIVLAWWAHNKAPGLQYLIECCRNDGIKTSGSRFAEASREPEFEGASNSRFLLQTSLRMCRSLRKVWYLILFSSDLLTDLKVFII